MGVPSQRSRQKRKTWPRGLAIGALVLVTAGCGSDGDPSGSAPADPEAQADTNGSPDPAASPDGADPKSPAGTGPTGSVTIGDQTWEFASSQCSVYDEETVSISGSATSDSAAEIVLDIYGPNEHELRVDADGVSWTATDSISATVDGLDVTGEGTVVYGVESADARFEFHCG